MCVCRGFRCDLDNSIIRNAFVFFLNHCLFPENSSVQTGMQLRNSKPGTVLTLQSLEFDHFTENNKYQLVPDAHTLANGRYSHVH